MDVDRIYLCFHVGGVLFATSNLNSLGPDFDETRPDNTGRVQSTDNFDGQGREF